MKERTIAVGCVLFGVALGALAAGDKQLAFSKRLGVEFLAEDSGAGWCKPELRLRVQAQDVAVFQSPDFQALVRQVGAQVLAKQCGIAERVSLRGFTKGSSKALYLADANKADGWALVAGRSVEAQSAAPRVTAAAPIGDVAPRPEGGAHATSSPPVSAGSSGTVTVDDKNVTYGQSSVKSYPNAPESLRAQRESSSTVSSASDAIPNASAYLGPGEPKQANAAGPFGAANQCAFAYLTINVGDTKCGMGLERDGRLTIDGRPLSVQLRGGYITGGEQGAGVMPIEKVLMYPTSPDGRYRFIAACDAVACAHTFIVALSSGDAYPTFAGKYGPAEEWISWAPDSSHAALLYRNGGTDWLYIVRSSDGKSWSALNEGGYVRHESLKWRGVAGFEVPTFSCGIFAYDLKWCGHVAQRSEYAIRRVSIRSEGPSVCPTALTAGRLTWRGGDVWAESGPALKETLVVRAKTVRYGPSPLGAPFAQFALDTKDRRDTYTLDCASRQFLLATNLQNQAGETGANPANATWRPITPESAVAGAVFKAICGRLGVSGGLDEVFPVREWAAVLGTVACGDKCTRATDTGEFELKRVDVDDCGTPAFTVADLAKTQCGKNGCMALFIKRGSYWDGLFERGDTTFDVLPERTNGLADLKVAERSETGWVAERYKWDGKKYARHSASKGGASAHDGGGMASNEAADRRSGIEPSGGAARSMQGKSGTFACQPLQTRNLTENEAKALRYLLERKLGSGDAGCLSELVAVDKFPLRGQTVIKYEAKVIFPNGYRTECLEKKTVEAAGLTAIFHRVECSNLGIEPARPGEVRTYRGEEVI